MTRTKINEPAREIPVLMEADLVVVGGGTTGPIAAIAAARRGIKVVLIERFGSLGGILTLGLNTKPSGAIIGGMTLVERSIDTPGFYTGAWPVQTHTQWERTAATLKQLPQLRQRLRALAARIGLPKDPS